MIKQMILENARLAVCGDRAQTHGDAKRNLEHTAALWNAYLKDQLNADCAINGVDVAHMLILVKMSRATFNDQHADHYVDMAGYAALAGDISDSK